MTEYTESMMKIFNEQMLLLTNDIRILKEACEVHQTRLECHRADWEKQEGESTDLLILMEDRVNTAQDRLIQDLLELENTEKEINDMWYLFEGLSTRKQEAIRRKKVIEVRCKITRKEHESCQSRKYAIAERLNQMRVNAMKEQDAIEAELTLVMGERSKLEITMAEFLARHPDLMKETEIVWQTDATANSDSGASALHIGMGGPRQIADAKLSQLSNGTVPRQEEQSDEGQKRKFCPTMLSDVEEEIRAIKKQRESLELGLGHMLHQTQLLRKWQNKQETVNESPSQRRKSITSKLERVFKLEENRLLGFPRGGERKGPMPVYHKRAELRRHLRSSPALVVIAGTGCGE